MSIKPSPLCFFPLPKLELKKPSPFGGTAFEPNNIAIKYVPSFHLDEYRPLAPYSPGGTQKIGLVSHALSPP
jgi:hypothetical protein